MIVIMLYGNLEKWWENLDMSGNVKVLTNYEKKEILNYTFANRLYSIIKRSFDFCVGLFGTVCLIPLAFFVQIANIIHKDYAPIFYTQKRVGKNGKIIYLYKFRSMVSNADEELKRLLAENPELKKEWDENQKLQNDPRITKLGKFLRKTSLDEVPQFINVLKGDMSLIGPRPLVIGELDKFGGDHKVYEKVRPGITGWWACNGRSDTSYKERLELEYYYVENASLKLDIKVIFKTISAVLTGNGAT